MDSYSAILSRICFEFAEDLIDGKLREAVELQLEDGIDLAEGEAALFTAQALAIEVDDDLSSLAPGVQVFAGFGTRTRCANDADDGVEIVEGNLVALQDVFALAGFAEEERGAAPNDVDAMIDEGADGLVERQFAGLAVEHGQEDHGEAFLHLGVLVELVEHNLRLRAALEFDDDAHAVAVALVAELVAGDVGDDFFVDQLGDALDELGLVDLVGISVTMIACFSLEMFSVATLARIMKRPRPVL